MLGALVTVSLDPIMQALGCDPEPLGHFTHLAPTLHPPCTHDLSPVLPLISALLMAFFNIERSEAD
jgi:hypothetical protein